MALHKVDLICSSVDDENYAPRDVFAKGIFHQYDYDFYYFNIQANAALWAENYLQAH